MHVVSRTAIDGPAAGKTLWAAPLSAGVKPPGAVLWMCRDADGLVRQYVYAGERASRSAVVDDPSAVLRELATNGLVPFGATLDEGFPIDPRTPAEAASPEAERTREIIADRMEAEAQAGERFATVLAACTDETLRAVLSLHRPEPDTFEYAGCSGCDQGGCGEELPEWPCRTFRLIESAAWGTVA